ncbi:MAG TPA: hypothetical protein PK156_33220 [Polyangium sp.]|nr:hypothetical protein [Polyangium sp.]
MQLDLTDPDEKDVEVPMNVALLVGGNGSGKSSVLRAIGGAFTALWSKFGADPLGVEDIRKGAASAQIEMAWLDTLKKARGCFAVRTIIDESGAYPDEQFDQNYKPWINAAGAPSRSSTGLIVAFDVHRLIPPKRVAGPNINEVVQHRSHEALAPTISASGALRPRSQGIKHGS